MKRALVLVLLLAAACSKPKETPAPPDANANVKALVLETEDPPMPDAPGKDAFVQGCLICHSPRYVTHQPRFTRTQWTATVTKMRAVYGAPFPESSSSAIVDYLVKVNGTE